MICVQIGERKLSSTKMTVVFQILRVEIHAEYLLRSKCTRNGPTDHDETFQNDGRGIEARRKTSTKAGKTSRELPGHTHKTARFVDVEMQLGRTVTENDHKESATGEEEGIQNWAILRATLRYVHADLFLERNVTVATGPMSHVNLSCDVPSSVPGREIFPKPSHSGELGKLQLVLVAFTARF